MSHGLENIDTDDNTVVKHTIDNNWETDRDAVQRFLPRLPWLSESHGVSQYRATRNFIYTQKKVRPFLYKFSKYLQILNSILCRYLMQIFNQMRQQILKLRIERKFVPATKHDMLYTVHIYKLTTA